MKDDNKLIMEAKTLFLSNFGNPTPDKLQRLNELRVELFKKYTDEELRNIFKEFL